MMTSHSKRSTNRTTGTRTASHAARASLHEALESLEPRKMLTGAPNGGSILFVDHDLLEAAGSLRTLPGTEVVFLDGDRDGVEQVSAVLANRRGLDSIQFASHGSSGRFGLGSSDFDALTLHDLAGSIAGWGDALSDNGDIVLWGCDVASDVAGRNFVRDLASITRADVAASINSTGNKFAGGDWVLEHRVGVVPTSLASPFMPGFRYVLGNNAPMIAGTVGFQSVTDIDTIDVFDGVTVSDADDDVLAISVTLDDAAKGVFTPDSLTASGFVSAGGGVYTFSGTGAAASAALAALVFNPSDNRVEPNNTELTTFTISADDGIAAATTDSTTSVFSVSVNDAPTIGGVSSLVAVADTGTVRPFPNVTIGDVDNPAQTLTVSITLDTAAKGVFTAGSLTASGFVDAGGGVYNFSGTAAATQTAIRQLYFDPTNNRVAPGTTEITTFTISVDDGIAAAVTNNSTRVYSVSVNDAPTIGATSSGQAVNDNATVSPFSAVTIGDVDSPAQTLSVSVTLDTAAKGVFTGGSLAAAGFTDAGGGVYTRTGTAAAIQAGIRQLVFNPTNDRVAVGMTESTTFTISVSDGLASPQTDNATSVISTSINDAPTIGGVSAGQAVNETSTVTPFSAVTIADPDSPGQTLAVSVTLDTAAKGVFTPGSLTASGFVSAGGGVYTFSGTASATQTAIRQLVFNPADNRVDTGMTETTTFTISVDDGVAAAATDNTTTVISTAINESPTIGGVSAGQAVTDTTTVTPFSAVTIGDVDTPAANLTVTVTLDTAAKGIFTAGSLAASGFSDDGGGVYSFMGDAAAAQTAIRQLIFNPADNRVNPGSTETTTFTISVDDGVATAVTDNTTTVVSTSVNDDPSVGGTSAGQAVNDNATVSPFSAVTIADADASQTLSVTVTLDTEAKGVFTPGSLTTSGFTHLGSGIYVLTGVTAAAAQTAIRALVFNPTNDRVVVGMTETTTFTIAAYDGMGMPAGDSVTTVVSTSINDAPAIGGVSAGQTTNDNANVSAFSAVTIVDNDPTQTVDVSVTLDTAAKGVFTNASLTASGFTDAGGGVYTLTGVTAAAAQTAIRLLAFDAANNRVAVGMTETTTFTISVDDGVAAASTDNTTTVVSTSVNDAPAIGATSAGQAVNDNATVTLFSAVTIGDVDAPAQTVSVSVTLDAAAKGIFTAGSLAASGFVDAGGGVYTFSGTASDAQTAIRQLIFNPTNDRVAVGSTETTTFTISVDDGVATAVTDNTTTVVSTSMNDAPTIGGASAGQTVNDTATITPFSAVTIADVDPSQSLIVSVSLDTAAKGVFTPASLTASGFVSMGGGVYTLSGVTASAAQTAIRLLAFDPSNNRVAPGMTETTTFTISVDDSVAAAATDNTTTAVSTSVNDAPTLGGSVSGQAVTDVTTVTPFTAVTIGDPDSPAQSLTVTVTLDTAAKGIFTAGSLAASGFSDDGGGVYSFTGTASAAQTAIRQLIFNPADNRVVPGATETTTFTISVDDGVASAVTDNTTTVVSASVNDAPAIGGTVVGQGVNDNSTVSLFSAVTIGDVDSPAQTLTVTVALDNSAKGVFTPGSLTASGFSSVGGGVYTFSGTAAAAQTAIRQLVYNPTDDRVTPGSSETTIFTISVNDGVASSTVDNSTTVVSVSINDAPTIGGAVASQAVNDISTVMPFATITVTDPDSPAQTQTVSITLDTSAKGVFTSASLTASGFTNAGGGVYTFSGTAAAAQSGMRQLVFNPSDNRVNLGATETTTFTISVDDGVAAAATNNTTTVVSTNVNDAPTIGGVSAGQAVNDNSTVTPFSAVTFADPDAPDQTQTVSVSLDAAAKGVFTAGSLTASGFVDAGGGVYTFSGTASDAQTAIRQLVFNPTNDRVAVGMTETTTFTITINDGVASDVTDATTTAVSTSMNDAPTIGGASAGQTVNENANVMPFSAVTIADVDPGQTVSVSVSLDTAAKGVFTPASLTASGFTHAGGGVYTLSGLSASDAQTAIRLLAFNPTDNRVDTGMTETTTFTISVDDSVAAATTNNTTTVVSTAVNDAPTIGGTTSGQAVDDNSILSPFSAVTIGDADSPADTLDISVTIDDPDKGIFTPGSLGVSGFVDAGGGVYTLTGVSAAAAQTAIRQLVFAPTANRVTVTLTETSTFTISADDGVASAVTDNTTTVVSTSINDASSIGGVSAGQSINDIGTITPFASVTITDADTTQYFTFGVTIDNAAKGVFTSASLTASGFTDAGSGVYIFSGNAAGSQAAIRQLVFNPTNDRVAVGMTETTTFTISVFDGMTSPATDSTTTVISTSVNDVPTIGGADVGQTVNDNGTLTPFANLTISDVDPSDTVTVSVAIDDPDKGVFTSASLTASGFVDAGGGVYTLAAVSASAAQAAIRQLVFNPADNRVDVGMTETSTFSLVVDDGSLNAADGSTTVISTSMNDAPELGGAVSAQAVNDNATVSPFASFTISEVDPSQFVVVSVSLDSAAKGVFTSASLTASGFVDMGGGVYTLPSSTAAAAQTAIRQLVFNPTNDRVAVGSTETTTFTVSADDGTTPGTNTSTTVVSTSMNDAPTVGGAVVGQAVNDTSTVSPFSSFTIADIDPSQTVDVTVTLDDADKGVFTSISLAASDFVSAGGGVYTLTGVTAAAAQAAIRQLEFNPANDRVSVGSTETTTFTVSVDDGVASAVTNNTTTAVSTSMNDAPTVGGAVAGQAVDDDSIVNPFSTFTIADVDPSQNVDISVTLDTAAKGVFTPGSLTASGFVSAGGGVYTLTGVTAAAAQAAIRQLEFNPTNDRVSVGSTETTTFTVSVDDGVASAVTNNTTTAVSTSMNDAPTVGGAVAGQTVNDTSTVSPFSTFTIADVDPSQTVDISVTLDAAAKGVFTPGSLTASGFVSAGGGVYTLTGVSAAAAQTAIRQLVFNPTNDRVAVGSTETTTFTVSVDDGVASAVTNNTTTAVSTSMNDAPTVGGAVAGQTVNDNATLNPFSSFTIADVDPSQNVSVSIAIDNAARGVFTPGSLTASGFVSAGSGVYTLSGVSAAAAQTAIRLLAFNPADNRVNPGSTETTGFAVSVTDGTEVDGNSTTTVISTSVNDAPVLGGAVSAQAVTDITTVAPFSTFTITDVDAAQNVSVSVTLDNAAKGVFTPGSLTASGFVSAGSGVYTLTGVTAASAQAAIRQLVFNPTDNRVASDSAETTTFTVSVNDGVASPATNSTTTVVSSGTNATPTLTTITILTGATARAEHTISYTALFAASNAADSDSGDTIVFRIEDIQNGTLTKNGEPVSEGVTTLGPGESLVWTPSADSTGTTDAFTVRAFDGTIASASAVTVRVTVTPVDPDTAAEDAPVSASSNSSGTVSIVTRNDAGETILLQQSNTGADWTRVNLTSAGVPTVTGGTASFVDTGTGAGRAAVVTASGLFLVSDDGNGNWTSRNLTAELDGPSIVGELSNLTTTDGFNVVAGRTASGDMVIYHETGGSNWTAVNLYDLLRNQSEPTPTFTSPIISYVTSWNGLNFGALDADGNIWTVWTGGGLSGWHSTNLSAITGAPTLVGGVTAYTTPWGGINLAGVDTNGDLTVTWWVPQFGGDWVNSNFSEQFGGPTLRPGTVTSYVTNWNALNIAGVDETGEIVQYWWVPPSSPDQDFWRVTPLTLSLSDSLRRPSAGSLTGMATQDSRLNLIGSSEDGHIVRLWWSPTTDWMLEDLTEIA